MLKPIQITFFKSCSILKFKMNTPKTVVIRSFIKQSVPLLDSDQ